MSIKDRAKGAAKAAVGISLVAAGLSSCENGGGVVDPLPPPLVCLNVETGQTLVVMGELVESAIVRVLISNHDPAALWGEVEIADLAGAELVEFSIPSAQRVLILLQPGEGVTSGSFVLQGTIVDQESTTCVFSRTFTFTVGAETATVTYNPGGDGLPLFARDRAEVILLAHAENVVEVEARTTFEGPSSVKSPSARMVWTSVVAEGGGMSLSPTSAGSVGEDEGHFGARRESNRASEARSDPTRPVSAGRRDSERTAATQRADNRRGAHRAPGEPRT